MLEETGFDLTGRLREEDAIEVHLGQKRTKLYIVPGVDEATHFAPQVRKARHSFYSLFPFCPQCCATPESERPGAP